MNWVDYTILIIIVVSVLYGAARGLIHSLFKLVGFVASIAVTRLYYDSVAKFIIDNTSIDTIINNSLALKGTEVMGDGILESLYLVLPVSKMAEDFRSYIVMVIINCLALFATFIVVKFALTLLELLLKEVFKLPVLRTINYSTGALFGLIESIFILLLIFALVVPISALDKFSYIGSSIERSMLAKYFYSYNLILKWLLTSGLNFILH